jgi:Zn-dependent peptidase ImmA (M78 family)
VPRKTILTEVEHQEVAQKFIKGTTQVVLAKEYRVSRKTIYRSLQQSGTLPERVAWTSEQVKLFKILKDQEVTSNMLTGDMESAAIQYLSIIKHDKYLKIVTAAFTNRLKMKNLVKNNKSEKTCQ